MKTRPIRLPANLEATALFLPVAMAFCWTGGARAQDAPIKLRPNVETTIQGLGVACTGIGQVRDEPRWRAYPVRLEFSGSHAEYLANEIITLSGERGGGSPIKLSCGGPWLLLKLPVGQRYRAEVRLAEKDVPPKSVVVEAPRRGQARYVLDFRKAH